MHEIEILNVLMNFKNNCTLGIGSGVGIKSNVVGSTLGVNKQS